MKKCRKCGVELPNAFTTDICLECSKENVRKIFKEYPDVKEAFHESIQEMKKPENMKNMVDETVRFLNVLQKLKS